MTHRRQFTYTIPHPLFTSHTTLPGGGGVLMNEKQGGAVEMKKVHTDIQYSLFTIVNKTVSVLDVFMSLKKKLEKEARRL